MIKAQDIGTEVYALLVKAVKEEYAGHSEAEQQQAIARILSSVVSL